MEASVPSSREMPRMDQIRHLNHTASTLWDDGVCTVCGAKDFFDFLELKNIPTQDGVLWLTREEAITAPRADISLSMCSTCGYIGNRLFKPDLVTFIGYNISLEHSPHYQEFIRSLASRLIEEYNLRGKIILDIGCGNGFFLKTMCGLGGCKGVGIDPSYTHVDGSHADNQQILFIKDFYSERYAQYQADLVCCRQVIDHLGSPKAFLSMVRRAMGDRPGSLAYFEVPNPERTLQQFVPWNLGYEHGSWFFAESFRLLFELCGFNVRKVSPCNDQEYLGIEAVPSRKHDLKETPSPCLAVKRLADDLKVLSHHFREIVSTWDERIQRIKRQRIRAIPWGAGTRAISFLSIFNVQQLMPFIVDINPARIGKYLPGTGQQVVPPDFLIDHKPDLVIITNPTYQSEIQEQARQLGLTCDFLTL